MLRKFNPLKAGDSTLQDYCIICDRGFKVGDEVSLLAIAPASEEDRAKMKAGKAANAVALPIHWSHILEEGEKLDCEQIVTTTGDGITVACPIHSGQIAAALRSIVQAKYEAETGGERA